MSKKKKKNFLSRMFGGKEGKDGDAATPGPPAGGEAFDLTMAPGYAAPTDGADLTMQPGYAGGPEHFKPESSGETGAVNFGRDLPPGAAGLPGAPEAGEMTMAPGYLGTQDQHQASPHGSHGPGVGAAPAGDFGAGEMTMAPGYLGTQAQHQGGQPAAADPFNFDVPNPGAAGVPAVDPFGAIEPQPMVNPGPVDPFGTGEMTMAPGYVGGGAPAGGSALRDPFAEPAGGVPDPFAGPDPFADAAPAQQPDPFADNNMTMAPGYLLGQPGAGAPAANPAAGAGFPGVAPGLDPYNPGDAAEMTMVPGYAGSGPAVPDPFNFDMPEPGGASAQLSPAVEAAALGAGADPNDPFGAPLLDDPGPGSPPPNPLAAASSLDDFMGEKTLVDMPEDIGQLATLRPSTEELQIDDLGSLAVGESDPLLATIPPPAGGPRAPGAGMGATPSSLAAAPLGQPMALGQPVLPGTMSGAPSAPNAVARPLFASSSVQHGATVLTDPSPSVVIDLERGLVFGPARPGGWSNVPPGFEVLSDGSVLGRAFATDAQTIRLPARPQDQVTATDEGLRLPAFSPGVKVDRRTGAVLVPIELEALLAWRPATVHRVEQGLVFLLPEGFRFEEDGSCFIPQPSAAGADDAVGESTSGPSHPVHGRLTGLRTWLGVQEWTYADGWTRVELPADATQEGVLVTLPASARRAAGDPPAGLQLETLADERILFRIPRTGQMAADGIWLAPIPGLAGHAADEPLADVDAAVREQQTYLGITDELLDNDWIRLTLPDNAEVTADAFLLPAHAAQAADPAILGSFDVTADGRLRFVLPEGSEVMGRRVLIPPPGPRLESPTESWITGDASTSSPAPAQDDHPSGPRKWDLEKERKATGRSKKVSAMDRFRSGKSEPKNDTLDFDGVLPTDGDDPVSSESDTKEHELSDETASDVEPVTDSTEAETETAETSEGETVEPAETETAEAETETETAEAETETTDGETETETAEAETETETADGETDEASDGDEGETAEAEGETPTKKKRRSRKKRSRKKNKSSEE